MDMLIPSRYGYRTPLFLMDPDAGRGYVPHFGLEARVYTEYRLQLTDY